MVIVCWRWRSALGYHYSGPNKYSTMIEICYRLPLLYCVVGKWRHFFCRVLLCYCVAVRANNSADARIILRLPDKQALLPCGALFCLFCVCSQRCPLSPPFHAVFNSLKESNLKSQKFPGLCAAEIQTPAFQFATRFPHRPIGKETGKRPRQTDAVVPPSKLFTILSHLTSKQSKHDDDDDSSR